jgi:hypothetical protein
LCRKSKYVLSSVTFFCSENRAVYEIMWESMVERDRPQITIWRMRIACCILEATNKHSQYVILLDFPLQQWLHELASMLRYTHIACLDSNVTVYQDRLFVKYGGICCSLTWICGCGWFSVSVPFIISVMFAPLRFCRRNRGAVLIVL